jgi:effector-binding domain-containing protein
MFEVQVRDVPEQTVLTEEATMLADELPGWIGGTLDRHRAALEAVGGATRPPLVLYHGAVTRESAGLVEVCTPMDATAASALDAATRVEPAHREAYVTIPKSLVAYPEILTAYDAVEGWVNEHGESVIASPREIYFADFAVAGPEDPVVDIAFPIADR